MSKLFDEVEKAPIIEERKLKKKVKEENTNIIKENIILTKEDTEKTISTLLAVSETVVGKIVILKIKKKFSRSFEYNSCKKVNF